MRVHHFPQVERAFFLGNNRPQKVAGNKRRQLAGDVRDDVSQRRFAAGFFRFFFPKVPDHRILALGQLVAPERGVRQNLGHFQKRGARLLVLHHQQHGVPHVLLKNRAAGGFQIIELVKNVDHLVDDKGLLLRILKLQHVQAKGAFGVRRIKKNHVLGPLRRHLLQHRLHQIAMRVNQANAFAVFNVLDNHVLQQDRFAGAGFADNVNVPAAVVFFYPNGSFLAAVNILAQNNPFGRQI